MILAPVILRVLLFSLAGAGILEKALGELNFRKKKMTEMTLVGYHKKVAPFSKQHERENCKRTLAVCGLKEKIKMKSPLPPPVVAQWRGAH